MVIKALVIKTEDSGENGSKVTLLTEDSGTLVAKATGGKKVTSSYFRSLQLLTYSEFYLTESHGFYIITDARLIYSFFDLSTRVEDFALASYFTELCKTAFTGEQGENEAFRLCLVALISLLKEAFPPRHIKAVFELRFLSIIGFEPLYGSCFACGKELIDVSCGGETEDGAAFFNTEEVGAVCRSCSALLPSKRALIPASKALLKAIAYSATAPVDKVFSFKTDSETEKLLAQIAETVVLEHIEIRPKSLKVYKDLTVIQ